MDQTAQPLTYPAVGIIERGFTHAARPGEVQHGWARAMCDSRLYVSIDHRSGHDAAGNWTSQIPLRATSAPSPGIDPEEGVISEGVDCIRCTAALAKWEREHPQAKEG